MVRSKHGGAGARGPSQRQLRVGELIRQVLSDVLSRRQVHDPELESRIITVTQVRPSPDMRNARVAIEPLGGEGEKEVLEALKRNRKYLRGELGKHMTTKFTPDLTFEIDESFAAGSHIDELLRTPQVARDIGHDSDD